MDTLAETPVDPGTDSTIDDETGFELPAKAKGPTLLAIAVPAAALGAVAIGAVAIGAFAVGRLFVRSARIRRLQIDELVVRDILTSKSRSANRNS